MRLSFCAMFAFSLLFAVTVHAEVDSGPKAGAAISPLKVFAATGDHAGKDLDYAAERGLKPTIYVFVPHERFDRPLARLLRDLEKGVIEAGNESSLVTIFLTKDEPKTREHLPRIQMSMQFTQNPLVVFPVAPAGPEGWAVDTDAQLTVVVVNKSKVVESFGYRSANETVAPEILKALKTSLGK